MNQKAEFEVLKNEIWESINVEDLRTNDIVRYKDNPETIYIITSEYLTSENNILYMEMIPEE